MCCKCCDTLDVLTKIFSLYMVKLAHTKSWALSLMLVDLATAKAKGSPLITAMSSYLTSSVNTSICLGPVGAERVLCLIFFCKFTSFLSIKKCFGHSIQALFNDGPICNGLFMLSQISLFSQWTLVCPLLCREGMREDLWSLMLGFELIYFLHPYLRLL